MAIIQCSECGKDVSTKAKACPACGAPTKYGEKMDKKERIRKTGNAQMVGCLIFIVGAIVIAMIFAAV